MTCDQNKSAPITYHSRVGVVAHDLSDPPLGPVHRILAGRGGRNGKTSGMPHVSGLRSCYAKVGRLVYFGRMLDKIRLHAAGQLPADYVANLGDGQFFVLDGRCCRFLGVRYADLREHTLTGRPDEADPYCPFARQERIALDWERAGGRDLPKIGSACTTVVSAL